MSKNCELGAESIARAELAIEKFSYNEFDRLVTLGWDYRADCATPIADVVKDYIINKSDIDKKSVIPITKSRDTVGDAFYCLDFFKDIKLKKIHVVTSDYHVNRTRVIFNKIFDNALSIDVYGVNTAASLDLEILQHEQQSLEAFFQTFNEVDFSSRREMFAALSKNHPFYNGKIYPKISCS